MKIQFLTTILASILSVLPGCNSNANKNSLQIKSQEMTVTVETMKQVLDAFNRHDLDAIILPDSLFRFDCFDIVV